MCFSQCLQKQIIEKCNCTDPDYLNILDQTIDACKTEEEIECQERVFTKDVISSDFVKDVCLPLCPLECNKTEFKFSLSSTLLVGDLFIDYINENENLVNDFRNSSIDSEIARQRIVSLNVFYDSLSYTQTTESPKVDVVSLLGYCGGLLGLFLGVSVFSICELCEALIEIIYFKIGSRRVAKFDTRSFFEKMMSKNKITKRGNHLHPHEIK